MKKPIFLFSHTNFYAFSWILLIFALSNACEKSRIMPDEDLTNAAIEISAFQQASVDLYQAASKDFQQNNFVISPLSIQLALYMLYNGAEGETQQEIGDLLHLTDADPILLNQRVKSLQDYLTGLVKKGHLDIHNAFFYDENRVELATHFTDLLKEYFDAHQANLDFGSPAAVETINGWVQDKTYDKIQDVIQSISDQELLFLINAIYLKADWVNGFPVESTADRPFTTINGDEVMVPTMHRTFGVEYVNQDGYQIARLPLADSALFTYFIMPDRPEDLTKAIESDVVGSIWKGTLDFENTWVSFNLPLIETKTHVPLNAPLQSLGMEKAFDTRAAELGPIGTSRIGSSLYVSRVLHDVFLKMDEKGVEGAAVTTIGVGTTSLPPSLYFDRPFLYMIVDHDQGIPVFIGQFTGVGMGN